MSIHCTAPKFVNSRIHINIPICIVYFFAKFLYMFVNLLVHFYTTLTWM